MALPIVEPEPGFSEEAMGIMGDLATPSGSMGYLQTKIRLAVSGGSDELERREVRLARLVKPYREITKIRELEFDQILQRDIDDHRVATSLIPYLLKPRPWPVFFPAILAVMLPFREGRPSPAGFPRPEPEVLREDQWLSVSYGNALRVERYAPGGKALSLHLGRVQWNEEYAKLVILDGQHRAMAVLAILRYLSGDPGDNYPYAAYYRDQIKALLEETGTGLLSGIELPVTLAWFKDPEVDYHKASRALFVDVNREAKRPSDSRLILLSENSLVNLFCRRWLEDLRHSGGSLDLPAIEYDNPSSNSTKPSKWSVVTSLDLIRMSVTSAVWGPADDIDNMESTVTGAVKQPTKKMNRYMRDQLDVVDLFRDTIQDGSRTLERHQLGDSEFPMANPDERARLDQAFLTSWGAALRDLLGHTLPYRAHVTALNTVLKDWRPVESKQTLARDSIAEGSGVYWTLRNAHRDWLRACKEARSAAKTPPAKPDVVDAWDILEEKRTAFRLCRAVSLLGSEKALENSEKLYAVFITHACQLGLTLAVCAVASHLGYRASTQVVTDGRGANAISVLALALADGLNASLSVKGAGRERRLCAFARVGDGVTPDPLNRIRGMNTNRATYFRYFWLEMLNTDEARPNLAAIPGLADAVTEKACEARLHYYDYLRDQLAKELASERPELDAGARREIAEEQADKLLKRILGKWFHLSAASYDDWKLQQLKKRATRKKSPLPEILPEVDEGGEDDLDGEEDEDNGE